MHLKSQTILCSVISETTKKMWDVMTLKHVATLRPVRAPHLSPHVLIVGQQISFIRDAGKTRLVLYSYLNANPALNVSKKTARK
jgi:hypothetical protein